MNILNHFKKNLYRDILTYAEYEKDFLNYKLLWRHKNESKALKSVMKIKDQQLLMTIASDTEASVPVRDYALSRITDKAIIFKALTYSAISMNNPKLKNRLDECIIFEINHTNDEQRLMEIACAEGMQNGTNMVRMAAIDKIQSLEILTSIAQNTNFKYTPVRDYASAKIEKIYGQNFKNENKSILKDKEKPIPHSQQEYNSELTRDEYDANADEGIFNNGVRGNW